jgi:hypothetical protein
MSDCSFSADLISAEFNFAYTKSQQKISKKTSEIFADFSADVAVRSANASTASPQFLLIKKKQKMETIFQNGIIARFHSLDGNIEHTYTRHNTTIAFRWKQAISEKDT